MFSFKKVTALFSNASERSEEDQDRVNYHEAGHAIVARYLGIDFECITNRPNDKTNAAGHMVFGSNKLTPKSNYDVFTLLMGGIVATDLALNHYDLSEAETDFQQCWDFLGKIMATENVTFDLEETGGVLFADAQDTARAILKEKLFYLHQIAAALKEKETLSMNEIDTILNKPSPLVLTSEMQLPLDEGPIQ